MDRQGRARYGCFWRKAQRRGAALRRGRGGLRQVSQPGGGHSLPGKAAGGEAGMATAATGVGAEAVADVGPSCGAGGKEGLRVPRDASRPWWSRRCGALARAAGELRREGLPPGPSGADSGGARRRAMRVRRAAGHPHRQGALRGRPLPLGTHPVEAPAPGPRGALGEARARPGNCGGHPGLPLCLLERPPLLQAARGPHRAALAPGRGVLAALGVPRPDALAGLRRRRRLQLGGDVHRG
mmetsp:Transcript_102487/g.306165  ORF Transcript_102487/g.306165 Transcript_102487/m.306165 type:complete len:240 (+) Transcript_102487:387-1106(+)